MANGQIVRIDKIKWWILDNGEIIPICPDHDLRMTAVFSRYISSWESKKLECAEGPHYFEIPRGFKDEKQYIIDRINARVISNMQVVDLDGELTPIAKEKTSSNDSKYFVTAQLMESKRGLQLVVYAGEKGKSGKTQIFIEPEIKRLAFDQKNLNPNDVFIELKATFDDGSSHTISKKAKKE